MEFSFFDESIKPGNEDYWRKVYKQDLEVAIINFSKRGLVHSAKWLAELYHTLKDVVVDDSEKSLSVNEEIAEDPCYYMCKCYFDLKEYQRCAYFAENADTPCVKFLKYYSKYMALEKKRLEEMTEPTCSLDNPQTILMTQLRRDMQKEKALNGFDGYCSYLYGVICRKLDLRSDALEAFCDAIRKEPLHWGAWQELAHVVDDIRTVKSLDIPHDHWMRLFFMGHLFLEHQATATAIQAYWVLRSRGLSESRYIRAQIAICYHNHRVVDKAVEEFAALHASDPYRLEHLDIYSNLLYVKEEKVQLSHLAHRACEIDKYRVETCCIVGNLYSLRAEHQKAVVYFQRALKVNPQYLSAWTLMGHEYMEMKNSSAAIQSYRQAIEANKRDYRAWYGLGQTYEILRMPSYSLYYYQQAHSLRPNDSRMLSAIGDTFEKLGQNNNAIRSYKLARNVGDIEGTTLIKLAKVMQKLGHTDLTAMLFKEYTAECEAREPGDKSELCRAYKFLASYCLRNNELTDAYNYAQKCLAYEEAKEEAKAVLHDIAVAQKNPEKDEDSPMEEESGPSRPEASEEGEVVWSIFNRGGRGGSSEEGEARTGLGRGGTSRTEGTEGRPTLGRRGSNRTEEGEVRPVFGRRLWNSPTSSADSNNSNNF